MSRNTLWIGPLFGIGLASWGMAACSGDAFKASDAALAPGDGAATTAQTVGGASDDTPERGTATAGRAQQAEGGAAPELLPTLGGRHSGDNAPGAGTGGAAVIDPTAAGGAGGAGGVSDLDPDCSTPIVEDWSAPLSEAGLWYVAFGDPRVDTARHRLVLSYDDVAERTQPYAGSYYVEGDVDIVGSTVFTPYPYTSEVLLPSLRRDAAGSGIQLGATEYAGGWSTSGWGSASGSVIAGTTQVHVAAYLQVSSRRFAVKVSHAGKSYRSTWVTDFHWAKTNLGIMRYVGENNSSVYSSQNDLIYVGPVSGCQGLSDAAVKAVFEN